MQMSLEVLRHGTQGFRRLSADRAPAARTCDTAGNMRHDKGTTHPWRQSVCRSARWHIPWISALWAGCSDHPARANCWATHRCYGHRSRNARRAAMASFPSTPTPDTASKTRWGKTHCQRSHQSATADPDWACRPRNSRNIPALPPAGCRLLVVACWLSVKIRMTLGGLVTGRSLVEA